MGLRTTILAITLATLPGPGHALGFDEALGAGAGIPAVKGVQVALQTRQQLDGLLPNLTGNPEFSAAVGPSLPGPGASLLVGAAQSWNLANLGSARRDAARAEREVLATELRAKLLQAHLEVAEAWIRTYFAQQQLRLVQAEVREAVELADSVTRAAARGAVLAADAAEARWFAAEARLVELSVEGRLRESAGDLSRTAGLMPEPPPAATGSLPRPQVPEGAQWDRQTAAAAELPEVAVARLQAIADRARAAEVSAQHGSALALGGQIQVDPAGNLAILGTIGLRWSKFEQGQRPVAVAQESAVRAEAQHDTALSRVRTELALARHEIEHAREAETLLRKEVLPAIEALTAQRQASLKRGAGTVPDLVRARRARLEVERRLAQAEGERLWAEVKGWLLLSAMETP